MRALTIKQPWAYAICHLGKRVENRTWKPSAKLIGQRVAIHAGVAVDDEALDHLDRVYGVPCGDGDDELPRGKVVATARLVGFAQDRGDGPRVLDDFGDELHQATMAQLTHGQLKAWWMGPIGHVLDDVRVLATPIPCKGALGYWRLPDGVAAEIEAQEQPATARVRMVSVEAEGDAETMGKVFDLFDALTDSLSAGSKRQ